MSDTGTKSLACMGAVVLLVVLIAATAILNGWVLSILWGWFVVPTFNLPPLTIPVAIGFSLIVSSFKSSRKKNKFDEDASIPGLIVEAFVAPLFALAFGYIIHLFM